MQNYIKKLILVIPFIFLCGFNKNDYKVEKIINDGSEFQVIIPKDFCLFKSKANDKFMSEYIDNTSNYYTYLKCSEVENINLNKKFVSDEFIMISISKKNDLFFLDKNFLNNNANAHKNTNFKEKLLKIDLDDFAKREKISNSEKQYLKENIDESIDFISNDTKADSKTINKNTFILYNYKSKGNKIYIKDYSNYIKGSLFNISYQTKNENGYLNNINDFSKYIEETQEINIGRINNYFNLRGYQILNIVSPNIRKFQDITDVAILNKYNHKKVFIETIDDFKKPKMLIGVSILLNNFNFDNFYEYLKKLYDKSIVINGQDSNYKYIKIQKEKDILYFYFPKIKSYNLLICSFIYYQPKNFNKITEDKYLRKNIKNYIKMLEKANKDHKN